MADLIGRWLAPAVLALVPALFRLRRGQTMARYVDDPAFPERLLGSRTLLSAVFAFALAIEIFVWPGHTWWSLPLLLLSLLAAGWPLRRAMFGETWTVASYLWFYVRLLVAIYGFWILLMTAPWLTRFDGPPWVAPLLVGIVLVAWNEQNTAVLRWILRARPVTDLALLERCRAIVTRSKIVAPNIEYVDMNGGVLVNAVALPDTKVPTVLFTSSLLERLDQDEVAGVFAHEVAHLEHFNPVYLRKLRWASRGIIAAAVAIGPLLHINAPRFEAFVWAWPFAVFAYTSILTARRQKHETESDARAVALTGDGEALVRGLVKLHALGKVPRRLDPDIEAHLSHPSLARRLQAIRAIAGVTAAGLDEPVILQSGATVVTLHADRLAWAEADGTSHAMPYTALKDLRIEAGHAGAARLSAADAHGRRWTLPLADTDVARAQTALDVIDARLRPAPLGAGVWRTIRVLVNFLVMIAALGAGQLAATIVALLASLSLEKPLVRAVGAAGLAGAALALRDGGRRDMALILLLSTILLLFVGSRDRRESINRWTRYGVWALGALALLALLPFVFATGGFLPAHQIANRWPAAAVFALAFAAAAAWPQRRHWRTAALAGAVAAVMVLVLGDTRTLDAVMNDPFLQEVDQPPIVHITAPPSSRTTFDFTPEHVQLSPRAESVAARVHSDDYDEVTYYIGRLGAALTEVQAAAVRFVDERRILVADPSRTGTLLRLIDTDRPAVAVWESQLDLNQPSISIDRARKQWRVLGLGMKGGVVQVTGAVDGGAVDRREWHPHSDPVEDPFWPLSVDGSRLLVRSTRYDSSMFATLGAWSYWLRPFNSDTSFAIVDGSAVSHAFHTELHVQCEPAAFTDEGPVCSAHDGSRFHLGVLDTAGASVTPLAKFQRAMSFQVAPGWITGWWNTPFALDRATGRLVLMKQSNANRQPLMMAASEESIGVLFWDQSDAGDTILEIYPRGAVLDH